MNSLKDLMEDQIKDLYNAEKQLVAALPKMAERASSPELKEAFQAHLMQTKEQVRRLERVAEIFGFDPDGKKCVAMEGLVKEGQEVLKMKGNPDVIDAALIAAAQRVEHYEISAYGTVATYCQRLGEQQALELLQDSLQEEVDTDEELTDIAETGINQEAAMAANE